MPDWTAQAADTVERVVGAVRDRAVVPVQRAGRAVVYGTFAAVVVLTALFLLAVGLFRLLTVPLPVWAAWMVLGSLLSAAGTLCWRLRRPREARR